MSPTVNFTTKAERVGGELAYTLYELSVTHPTAKTWHLAAEDLDADALYAGSPAYEGLVDERSTPPSADAAVAGFGLGATLQLVLRDTLGSQRGGGPWRTFSDLFAAKVPGYAEPYDLQGATLVVKFAWAGNASGDVQPVGRYAIVPGGVRHEGGRLVLSFEEDRLLTRALPRHRITAADWPAAPVDSIGRPIPLVFGSGVKVPVFLVAPDDDDASSDGDDHLVCLAPTGHEPVATAFHVYAKDPTTDIEILLPVTSVPGSPAADPFFEYNSSGAITATIADNGLPGVDVAIPLYFANDSYLIHRLALELRAPGGQDTVNGRMQVSVLRVVGVQDGVIQADLVEPSAAASKDMGPNTNALVFNTFDFNPPFLYRAGERYWIRVTYVKDESVADTNDLQMAFDTSGTPLGGERVHYTIAGTDRNQWQAAPANVTPSLRLYGAKFTTSMVTTPSGARVMKLNVGTDNPATFPGRRFAVTLDGLKDDGSGTYTGTAGALIQRAPDIARFLLMHASALGLAAGRVNTASLDAARTKLQDWFLLAGVVYEPQEAAAWLGRLGRCAKAFFYEDADGKVAMFVEGRTGSVRLVRPWEHGPLTLHSRGEGLAPEQQFPWSKVEVFAKRDLCNLENPDASRSRVPEWDEYAVVSVDQTSPADAARSAQAAVLDARYGHRGNGSPTSDPEFQEVSEEAAFFFVHTAADAVTVRNHLWDTATRVLPFDVVTVPLPRFALGWRIGDEFQLESWDFPSETPRARIGEVVSIGGGPESTIQRYAARRGRYSIRHLQATTAAHGSEFPVLVTGQLIEWEAG
jgi:hypothetical protein